MPESSVWGLTIVGIYLAIGFIFAAAAMEVIDENGNLGFFMTLFLAWPLAILMLIGIGIGRVIKWCYK